MQILCIALNSTPTFLVNCQLIAFCSISLTCYLVQLIPYFEFFRILHEFACSSLPLSTNHWQLFFHLHIHNAIIPLMSYQYWHGIFLTGNKLNGNWLSSTFSVILMIFIIELTLNKDFECLVLQEETLKWVRMLLEIITWKRSINFLSFALVTRPFIPANIIIMLVFSSNFLLFNVNFVIAFEVIIFPRKNL